MVERRKIELDGINRADSSVMTDEQEIRRGAQDRSSLCFSFEGVETIW